MFPKQSVPNASLFLKNVPETKRSKCLAVPEKCSRNKAFQMPRCSRKMFPKQTKCLENCERS
ncbi:hypothetical protein M9Y10_019691 [Tritrichomonas musculus]|uniref:Uncharacterized protein n=1 Tax=Tritrichomonas musculus TaxID=1915356 RepID=A0ABR2HHY2_9EUKA